MEDNRRGLGTEPNISHTSDDVRPARTIPILVRVQVNSPASGEVFTPFAIGHFVAECRPHQAPLMQLLEKRFSMRTEKVPVLA